MENNGIAVLRNELPTLSALMALNARPGVDVETLARQEIEYLEYAAIFKPEIKDCIPQTIVAAVKGVLKKNLTLDPDAGLVYITTRSVQVAGEWKKALVAKESGEGMISVARQCGRILDIERPVIKYDAQNLVIGSSIRILLPSTPEPRWQTVEFTPKDFYRWKWFSHRDKSRNKQDANPNTLNYANALYTSWQGGMDPEFCAAKTVRHSLKRLGVNVNEVTAVKIQVSSQPQAKERILSKDADLKASEESTEELGGDYIPFEEQNITIQAQPVQPGASIPPDTYTTPAAQVPKKSMPLSANDL